MDAPPSLHPTDQTLLSHGLGKLDDLLAETVNRHLEGCPDCRHRVAGMSSDSFLGRLRGAQGTPGRSDSAPSRDGATRSHPGAHAPAPPPDSSIPPGLAEHPDYEIRRELGRGGMGVVYLAHNRLMARDEVLKVMGREIVERPGVLDRFLREIRAVAKLRHPNIVTAYSAVRLGASIVFAMEYVEGLDLAKMGKLKGPMPVAHACSFVHQAALGLQHAHEEGLVHRDIKPGNLMLSRKGNKAIVKVLDFGLARATREQKVDGGLTHEGQALGTPDFIAPEQILDAPSADIRADIYSLGGTLYYLLTGRPPFRANSLYDLYQAHISRDADPLNFVRPEVPAELAALVAKMMAKDPARRFQTPAEVAQALTPFFKNGNARFRSPQAHLSQAGLPDTGRTPTDARPLPSRTAADPGTAPLPKSTVEPPGPEPTWSSLIDLRETEPSLAPVQAAGSPRRPRWVGPAVGVGLVLLGLLVAWAAGVFRVQTRDGVIVLEDLPKDAEVFVDGSRVTVNWPDGGEPAEITVPAGQRGVQVKRGGFETFGQRVTVATGGKAEIRVRFEPPATSRPDDVAAVGANPADGSEPGALAAFSQPGTNDAESRAFVPLFNGRDFSGWKEHPRQPGNWRIKDGVLIGSGPAMGHLYTRRDDYRDFHLRIEDRINDVGNSGVIFRAPFGPAFPPDNPRFPLGYEAQINNLHRDPNKTGSLYVGGAGAVVGLPRSPTPPFQWFTLEVIAVGNHIVIKVNGVTTTDYTDEQRRLTSGHIALQQFGPETIAEFRKVEIRELPAIPQAARPADARAFLGKSYKVFNQPLSWHEAQERCRAMGGHLAIVTNERESGFLLSLLRAQGLDATWLGATDERVEGQWMWVDGSPMRYSNWDLAQRQPNNKMGSEHYLMILASRDGKWSDQPDHSDQYRPSFICQWD